VGAPAGRELKASRPGLPRSGSRELREPQAEAAGPRLPGPRCRGGMGDPSRVLHRQSPGESPHAGPISAGGFDLGRCGAYGQVVDSGLIVPFGRYVLTERLAQGGMGEVFRAVAVGEHGFEKPVVVKRVLPVHAGRDDLTELFLAEARLMTRLSHPNIVEVYDFGRGEHKDYYLVLELVDGVDLRRLA